MTADDKLNLARLLDTTGDYLRDGYRLPRGEYRFTGDEELPPEVSVPAAEVSPPDAAAVYGGNDTLEGIAAEIGACTACTLHSGRKNVVPGDGLSHPLVLVIGEGPGADEDASGKPFVGKAGQLLDRMLASVGLSREKNCFISNMVKCRPPNNRDPLPDEIGPCSRFLVRQITLLNPKIILCVGRVSAHALLKSDASIGSLRLSFHSYQLSDTLTIPLLVSYHPSAILRDESYKRPAWEDLKLLRQRLIELDKNYALEAGEGGA